MAGSGFGICFPKTVAKVGCGVPTATGWRVGVSLHPVWMSELKSGCKLKPPNQVSESLPNIRQTSGAIGRKTQKMRELPITNLVVQKEKVQLFCSSFYLYTWFLAVLQALETSLWAEGFGRGVWGCCRTALSCRQMWWEQWSAPLKSLPQMFPGRASGQVVTHTVESVF